MNPALKFLLIAMIAISVVSDAMLLPFYPQFFQSAFGLSDPQYVGAYLSATCLAVMLAFPAWAALAKRVPVVNLLIYTQFAAGVLSILCYAAQSLLDFWLASLGMLVFKGSYLLIYPFIMRFEEKDNHGGTIGLLSVIVHLGAILGAGLGGLVLELFDPRQVFLLMSLGDFAQMLVCLVLLGTARKAIQATESKPAENEVESTGRAKAWVYKLGFVMLIFYFSAWLVRPFFARYWESISAWNGETASGLVFAIPGGMALLALCLKKSAGRETRLAKAVALGILGLLLQASQQEAVVLAGRLLYGWALFHTTVRLDLVLFEISAPEAYAADFSKIYFFQSLGALFAMSAAGALVSSYGLATPLLVAAAGLASALLLYALLFQAKLKPADAL